MNGEPFESRIYEDGEGDEFVLYNDRYFEFENFFYGKWVSKWFSIS